MQPVVLLKMVLVALFWGGTFIAGRVIAAVLNPLDGAVLRFLIGGSSLALALWKSGGWCKVGRREMLLLVGMGLTGIIAYNLFFLAGMRYTSASRASLIIANNPVGIMLGAWLIFGERLGRRQLGGIVLSLAGAMMVVLDRPEAGGASGRLGELLIFGAVASWVTYTLLARKVLARLAPLVATTYSTLAGMVILVVCAAPFASLAKLRAIPFNVWVACVFIGLCGTTLAFTWFLDGVAALGASRAGQFINLVPVFAVCLSMLMLGERPSLMSLAGGLMVIGGLLLTQTEGSGRRIASAVG